MNEGLANDSKLRSEGYKLLIGWVSFLADLSGESNNDIIWIVD